jgi:DNA-binding CsgD family transcriptional regulator
VLYGRDAERDRIGALLKAARASQSGALVLRGEPGVGKSALLDDTRERAGDMHVLSARGVESEAELPFAALHQLLRNALGHVDALPAPQANALRAALGLADAAGYERFLVSAACLSLLSELSEKRPVLCLVDDAHWLDTASAEALLFVARRLEAEGIVMLFGAREGEARSFEARDLPSLTLHGLEGEAAATLVARVAGARAAPGVVDRLVEQTRGNALALLELPAALTTAQLAGEEPMPEALPLTDQVEGVFLDRVRRLPEGAQRFLLVAAADDSEDLAIVSRAAHEHDAGPNALDEAERAGLVSVSGTQLAFRHPLVRSAVYGAATANERRAAHRALAAALAFDDQAVDRHAWHLAASVVEFDDGAVGALEQAAARAASRGGFLVAVRAHERAVELSSDDEVRGRNLVAAARWASRAAEDDRAVALAERAAPLVDAPLERAEIAEVLGIAEIRRGRPADAAALLLSAAREIASISPVRALELLLGAAWGSSVGGDWETLAEIVAAAAPITAPAGDEVASFIVDSLTGLGAVAAGDSETGLPMLERTVAWAAESDDPRWPMWAGASAMLLGDYRRSTALVTHGAALARTKGEIGALAQALGMVTVQSLFAQEYDEAELAGEEAVRFARDFKSANALAIWLGALACIAAVRGDEEKAVRHAEQALERATKHGLSMPIVCGNWALALVDLGRGRWDEAVDRLDHLAATATLLLRGVAVQTWPDRIEAAVRANRRQHAIEVLEHFAAWVERSPALWAPARLAACRALVSDDGDDASALFEEAVGLTHDGRPFDRARIQLLYGEHLRREHRRTDARVQLRGALEAFERMRAARWAERAALELRATGETARKRDPSTLAQLTPQEVQISRLVAEGFSNKEIAAQLFLSPRTIDYHLRKVFAKLGITSRTQLARIQLGEPGATPAPA